MIHYYATVKAEDLTLQPDGKLYAYVNLKLYTNGYNGVHVIETEEPRLLAAFDAIVWNGEALVYIGRAGDRVAQIVDLPKGCRIELVTPNERKFIN